MLLLEPADRDAELERRRPGSPCRRGGRARARRRRRAASTRYAMSSRFEPASTIAQVTVGSRLSSISRAQRKPVGDRRQAARDDRRPGAAAPAPAALLRGRGVAHLQPRRDAAAERSRVASMTSSGSRPELLGEVTREQHGRRAGADDRDHHAEPGRNARGRREPGQRLDERALQLVLRRRHAGSAGPGGPASTGASRSGR